MVNTSTDRMRQFLSFCIISAFFFSIPLVGAQEETSEPMPVETVDVHAEVSNTEPMPMEDSAEEVSEEPQNEEPQEMLADEGLENTEMNNEDATEEDTTEEDTTEEEAGEDEMIVEIPFGVTLEEFEKAIKPAPEASFEVYEADGETVATELLDDFYLVVTAGDGVTEARYKIKFLPNIDATISVEVGNIDPKHTTFANIPFGTTLDELKAMIVPAPQATFEVFEVDGKTRATDVKNDYKIVVTAGDGKNKRTYKTQLLANTDATVSMAEGMGEVDHEAGIINNVPYGTDLKAFKNALFPAPQAEYEIYKLNGRDVATHLAEGYKLEVVAGDKTTKRTYSISFAPNTEASANVLIEDLWEIVRKRYEIK